MAAASRTRGLPLVLRGRPEVLDADGVLRYRGAFDDVTFRQRTPTRFYVKEAVEALLAGHLPDPAEAPPYGCTVVGFVLE